MVLQRIVDGPDDYALQAGATNAPISRRDFTIALGAVAGALTSPAIGQLRNKPLRVIAYNAFGGRGWPADRPKAKKAQANAQIPSLLAAELGSYEPDIINFSESPGEDEIKEIAKLLEMKYAWFPSGSRWPGALLSRLEISETTSVPLKDDRPKELFTRHWGRCAMRLGEDESLIVHSVHLFPTEDSRIRLAEIAAMLDSMRADLDAGRSLLVMGDLNLDPKSEEHKRWIDGGFIDTFQRAGRGDGLTYRSDIPKWRVDYILAAGPIAEQIDHSRALFEGSFRLNLRDPDAFALSDHLPVLTVFR
jgi:endonuclease/exonuclease/phosphatase family metal-dependent hydrolase